MLFKNRAFLGYPMPPPGMMPPFGMGMPPFGMPPFGADPASVWQEFTSPDGRKYYFNAQTQETTWDKPQALKDKEGMLSFLFEF